jgi:cell division protein FtsI/penicillin-binding protein 2
MIPEKSWRYMLAGALLLVLPVLIFFQLFRVQASPEYRKQLEEQSKSMSGETVKIVPPRGQIYDRNGEILATNQIVYEAGVELAQVQNAEAIARALSLVLGEDYQKIFGAIESGKKAGLIHVTIARSVTQEQYNTLDAIQKELEKYYKNLPGDQVYDLSGLSFQPYLQRMYPEKSLASNILGFVNRDGQSYFGVEEQYEGWLLGKPVDYPWIYTPVLVKPLPELPEGTSLVLTIDRAIQASMEELIDREVDKTGSESGTIVVVDPSNGEVLAMATTPRMDLNQYWLAKQIFTDNTPFNRAVSGTYEPGSVYKVLTMAAGLDSGAVTTDTEFLDRGFIEIGGAVIRNWNSGAWGPQDMQGCMQHSLNVCLAWVAKRMGPTTFYSYMQRFGIGHLSGIDLSGDVPGRLKLPGDSNWYEAELGTNSFGQGVAATPLQMAAAISAVANDGKMMKPHVVRSLISKGYQKDIEPQVISAPISPQTAQTLTELLARSLENESSVALVDGYRVAGKTGTAEIPTEGGYTSNLTNASFVGWGPLDQPRFLVYIWLEKPRTSQWGSEVAAPVFSQAVERLVRLMDIPPDQVRQTLLGQ